MSTHDIVFLAVMCFVLINATAQLAYPEIAIKISRSFARWLGIERLLPEVFFSTIGARFVAALGVVICLIGLATLLLG
jgi:hypothetical protein